MELGQFLTALYVVFCSFVPLDFQSLTSALIEPLRTPPGSFVFSGFTPEELAVVSDPKFRQFIMVLAGVEDNYRKAGTLDTEKLLTGALQGALKYGTGDKHARFIPKDEEDEFIRKGADGEKMLPDGTLIQETLVKQRLLRHRVAYIAIVSFRESMIGQWNDALVSLSKDKPSGLVLDLRDNMGGTRSSVLDVMLDLIEPHNVVCTFVKHDGTRTALFPERSSGYRSRKKIVQVHPACFFRTMPLVVIINNDSASASEIMAAALRDWGRARLVGQESFGKGSYQSYGSSLLGIPYMTDGRWLTPNGQWIQDKGLSPDFVVKDTRFDDDRDSGDPYDAQLHTAVKILQKEIWKVSK